ncbi:MAG: hypothetical protein ACXWB9_11075 [Flavisolibacter sp.]
MSKSSKNKTKEETPVKAKASEKRSVEYETMSQQQNRAGKGRQQNGSDGTSVKGRGSNH